MILFIFFGKTLLKCFCICMGFTLLGFCEIHIIKTLRRENTNMAKNKSFSSLIMLKKINNPMIPSKKIQQNIKKWEGSIPYFKKVIKK